MRHSIRRTVSALTVLAATALMAPAGTQAHGSGGKSVRVKIELPLTISAPGAGCPASSFFALDYRISSKGKRGTGTNCVVGFTPVACEPDLCSNISVLITFRLPGGTITAEGSLVERGPCDPATGPECTTLHQSWSGVVVDATRGYHKLEGAAISGGGTAQYRFPVDFLSPFASLNDYVVVIGDRSEEDDS